MTIPDKDIGDLWQTAKLPVVHQFIEKIVEDRIFYYEHLPEGRSLGRKATRKRALLDFGIDRIKWGQP